MTTATAGTKGFLFCDLRGYTAFVERSGDAAAAELLATYRALVRSALAAHAGAEIKTEGDSVYVVFPAASGAVEAGLALVAAAAAASTKARPIRVGVGIHAGETVATTEGLVGGAVNIAARVCAKAQAGEVLVTDTVRALTRTYLPYRYTSLGTQALKGIAGGIPLFRVEAVPASRLAHLRRQLGARRRRVLALAGLAVVLVAAGAGLYLVNRPPDCLSLPASTKDVVARIDPARNCVVATYPVGRGPSLAVWAHDKLWVANDDDGTIMVLSAAGRPVATVGIGGTITAMAPDGTYMWVLDGLHGVETRVWLDSASVVNSIGLFSEGELVPESAASKIRNALGEDAFQDWARHIEGDYLGLAAEPGRVWSSDRWTGTLVQLDEIPDSSGFYGLQKTYQVDAIVDPVKLACTHGTWDKAPGVCVPLAPYTSPGTGLLAIVGHTVWATHQYSPDLAALDVGTGTVSHLTPTGATGGTTGLAVIGDDLWAAFHGGQVARIRSGRQLAGAQVASSLAGIAGDANSIWVASPDDHSVTRLDPASLAVVGRVDVGGEASGVAVAPDGSVWVTIH